jgi:rRNA biogenesis protein RRP5
MNGRQHHSLTFVPPSFICPKPCSAAAGKTQFAHGTFVQCRVLEQIQSKPIVEVSLRQSRLDGDLEKDSVPEVGDTVQAFVVTTSKKGCFLRLGRHIEGRTILKELCDGFLPTPEASFPTGRLVVGKLKNLREGKRINGDIKVKADIDMRGSVLVDDSQRKRNFEELEIGQKHKASVMRIEEYGVFVKLDNCDISGLVHKSECSEKFIKNLLDLYDPGDVVKVLLLKKDNEKKQVGFSMKASHFIDDDSDSDDDDEDSVDDEAEDDMAEDTPMLLDDGIASEDENFVSKLSTKMNKLDATESDESEEVGSEVDSDEDDDVSDDDTVNDASDEGEEQGDDNDEDTALALDTNVGFDWTGDYGKSKPSNEISDDDISTEADVDENDGKPKSLKARQKHTQRQKEEHEISRREIALADGTADENPESAADFERMLAGEPNSSELWIRYMAFYLTMANIPAARSVANRAFDRIEFRQEKEKLNVWCALLTLELKYGTDATLQAEMDRACQHNNPKHVYLRVCEMMVKNQLTNPCSGVVSKTDVTFVKMCSKFRSKKKVWIAHLSYLLEQGRYDEAQKVIQRALLSLPTYKHVETLSKYATLAFSCGQVIVARTVFDGLLVRGAQLLSIYLS